MKPKVKKAQIKNWGSNVAKSMKYASIDLLKSTAPFMASTSTSMAEMSRDVRSSLYKTKIAVNSQTSVLNSTNIGKKAKQLADEALNDLKSGNLVLQNTTRDIADSYKDMDFDFASDFSDFGDFGTEDSSGGNMAGMVQSQAKIAGLQADQISKSIAVGNAAYIEALQASTNVMAKSQIKGNEILSAQIVNLGLMSINAQAQQMQVVNNQLEAMNKNLVNLVQFNNDNVSPSNQAMMTYFDKSLDILDRLDKNISSKEEASKGSKIRTEKDKFAFMGEGFNFGEYGKFAKKNFDNTLVGSAISMLKLMRELDSMDGGKKPIRIMDKITRFAVKSAIPTSITKQIAKTDKNVSRFIKSALMDLGDKQYDYSRSGVGGMMTRFLSSIFGVERTRTKNISMGNFYKDQMSWNGISNRILTEAIPSYLANIEAALTEKERRYYDPQSGRFKKESKLVKEYDEERDSALQSALYPVLSKLNTFLDDNAIGSDRMGSVQDRLNELMNQRLQGNYNDKDFKREISEAFSGALNKSQFQDITMGLEESFEEAMKTLDELRKSIEQDQDRIGYRQINNRGRNLDRRNASRSVDIFGMTGRGRDFFSSDIPSTIMGFANSYISPEEAARGFQFKLKPEFINRFQKESMRSDDEIYLSRIVQKEVNAQKQQFFREGIRRRFNVQNASQRFSHVAESASDRMANFDADVYTRLGGYGNFVPLNSEYGGEGEGGSSSGNTNPNLRNTINNARQRASSAGREVRTRVSAATSRLRSAAGSLRPNEHIRRAQANITALNDTNFEDADLDTLARNQDEIDKGMEAGRSEFEGEERAGVNPSDQRMSSFMNIMTGTLLSMQNSFSSIFSGVFGKKGIIHKIWDSDWRKQFTKDLADKLFNEEHGIFKNLTKHAKDAVDYGKYLWGGKGYTNRFGKTYEDTDNNAKFHLKTGYNKFYDLSMRGAFGDDYEQDEFFQKYLSKWRFDLKGKKKPEPKKTSSTTNRPTDVITDQSRLLPGPVEETPQTVENPPALLGLPDLSSQSEQAKEEMSSATTALSTSVRNAAEDVNQASNNFTDALFGEEHRDPEKQKKSFLSKFKSNLPKTVAAGIAGAGLVLASGGTMGLLGGLFLPNSLIGGAIVGMGVQLATKSKQFNEFVFGKEDEEGNKKGGLISSRMQKAFKKALPAAAFGALLGAGKSMLGFSGGLPGMGFLTGTLLPGGILGGALLGMGVSLVKNSDTFQNIVFGKKDEEGKRQGILAKGFRSAGDKMKAVSPKLKSGLKGLAVGAITGATLSHMGVLGSALSLGGPVGMGIAGLGFGILNSTKRFNEYLFGHEELDADGNPTGKRLEDGLLPRLKNLVTVNVLDPIKQQIEDSVANFSYWAKDKITYPFRLAFGPVLDALGGLKDDIGDFVKDKFDIVGEGISNIFKKTFDTITSPFTRILGKIGQGLVKTVTGMTKFALTPVTATLGVARLLTSPARAKSELGFIRAYGGSVKDQLTQQWDGKNRSFLGKTADTIKLLGNKDARDAARDAWIDGMGLNGMDHLGWRSVNREKKADKEAKKARVNWKPIDKLRQQYVKEDRGNGSVYWSEAKMEKMRKSFAKRGIAAEDIATEEDLRNLIFHKDDWKDRVAKRKSEARGNIEAGMKGMETPEQATARDHTTKFETDTTGLLQSMYDLMLRRTQEESERQRSGKSKKKTKQQRQRLLKKLNKLGINPDDLGIKDVMDYQDMSEQDWELFRDSEDYGSGDFDSWYKKNLWRWNKGVSNPETAATQEAEIPTPEAEPQSTSSTTDPFENIRRQAAAWAQRNPDFIQKQVERAKRRASREARRAGQMDILDADGNVIATDVGNNGITQNDNGSINATLSQLSHDIRNQNIISNQQLQAQMDTNEALYPPGTYNRDDRVKDIADGKADAIDDETRDAATTTQGELTSSIRKGMTSAMTFIEDKKNKLLAKFGRKKKEDEETAQARGLGDEEETEETGLVPVDSSQDGEQKSEKKTSFLSKLFGMGKGLLGGGLGSLSKGGGLLKNLLFGKYTQFLTYGLVGGLFHMWKEKNPKEWEALMGGGKTIFDKVINGVTTFWTGYGKPFLTEHVGPAILDTMGFVRDLFVDNIGTIIETTAKFMADVAGGIWKWGAKKLGFGEEETVEAKKEDLDRRIAAGGQLYTNPETGEQNMILGEGMIPVRDENGDIMYNEDGTPVVERGRAGMVKQSLGRAGTVVGVKTAVTGLKHGKSAAIKFLGNQLGFAAKTGATIGGGVVGAGVGNPLIGAVVGSKGAKLVGKAAKATAKLGNAVKSTALDTLKKLVSKLVEFLKKLVDTKTCQKLLKKFKLEPKVIVDSADDMAKGLTKAIQEGSEESVTKAATKASNRMAKEAAQDGSAVIPYVGVALQVGFTLWDAGTGWFEAARLFGVNEDMVDWKMSFISSLMKVISGAPYAWVADLAAEVVADITGRDFKKWLATTIYKFVEGDDAKIEKIENAQLDLEIETEKYNLANGSDISAAEYSRMKNTTVAGKAWNWITGKGNKDFSQYSVTDADRAKVYAAKAKGMSTKDAISSTLTAGYGNGVYYGTGTDGKKRSKYHQRKAVGYAEIPGVSQSDPRWADYTLGTLPNGKPSTMENGGCGPTALASVAAALTKSNVDPVSVASYAKQNGYIAQGGATEDLFTSGASKLGLKAQKLDRSNVVSGLTSGKPVVLAGRSGSNDPSATPFTKAGHIVTATGLDQNGNVRINDPRSGESRSYPLSVVQKNMTTAFAYDKGTPAAGYGDLSRMKKASGYGMYDDVPYGSNTASGRSTGQQFGGYSSYMTASGRETLKQNATNKTPQVTAGIDQFKTSPKEAVFTATWDPVVASQGRAIAPSDIKKFADVGLTMKIPAIYTEDWLKKFRSVTDATEILKFNGLMDDEEFLRFREAQMKWKIYNKNAGLDKIAFSDRLTEIMLKGYSSHTSGYALLSENYKKSMKEKAAVVFGLQPADLYGINPLNKTNAQLVTGLSESIKKSEAKKLGLKDWNELTVINGMPYYSLLDPEWADLPYRGGTVATKGKDLVMLAQMLSCYTRKGITPKYLLNAILPNADKSIYNVSNGISAGIQWDKMFDPTKGIQNMKELYDSNGKPLKVTKLKVGQPDFYSKVKDLYPILMNGTEYTDSPFGGEGDKFSPDNEMWGGAGISVAGSEEALHMINPYTTIDNPISSLMSKITDLGGPTFTTPLTRETAYMFNNSEPNRPFQMPKESVAALISEEEKMIKKADGNTLLDKAKTGIGSLLNFFKKFTAMGQELFMSKMEGREYERQLDEEGNLINKEEAEQAKLVEATINQGLANGEIGNNGDPYIQGDDYVGKFVKRFESGSKGSTAYSKCGNDGGGSYGSYQMIYGGAGDSARRFWKKYYAAQYGEETSAADLKNKWIAAATEDPAGFFANEHQFISDTYYKPARAKIQGVDPDKHSRMLQESLWSWSVHRGPTTAANEFNSIGMSDPQNIPPSQMIDKIYDKRGAVMRSKGWASIADGRYGKGADSERAVLQALGDQGPLFNTSPNASTASTSTVNAAGIKVDEATEFGNKLREALAKKYGIPSNKISSHESAKREYSNLSKQARERVEAGESYSQVSEAILKSIEDGTSSKNKGITSTTTKTTDSGRSTVHTSSSGRLHGGGGRSFGDESTKLSSPNVGKSLLMPIQALAATAKHFNCSTADVMSDPMKKLYYQNLLSKSTATGSVKTGTTFTGALSKNVYSNITSDPFNTDNLFGASNSGMSTLGYGKALGYGDADATSTTEQPTGTVAFQDYINEKTSGGTKNLSMDDMFDSFAMLGEAKMKSRVGNEDYSKVLSADIEAKKAPVETAENSTTGSYDPTTGTATANIDTSGDRANNFPFYLQSDPRWGGTPYTATGNKSQTIATSGCGTTSAAMVLKSYGVNVTPVETSQYSLQHGYRTANSGTSWGFFPSIGSANGLSVQELGVNGAAINQALQSGYPVIGSMKPPTFTKGGHFIVLSGITGNGEIMVNDPASRDRTAKKWPLSVFTREGKNYWAFNKGGKGSIGKTSADASKTAQAEIPKTSSPNSKGSNELSGTVASKAAIGYGDWDKKPKKLNVRSLMDDALDTPVDSNVSTQLNLSNSNGGMKSSFYGEGVDSLSVSTPVMGAAQAPKEKVIREKIQVALNADGVENKLDGILGVMKEWYSYSKATPTPATSGSYYGDTSVTINNQTTKGGAKNVVLGGPAKIGTDTTQDRMRKIHESIARKKF